MNAGIEIEFYEPPLTGAVQNGRLITVEKNRNLIEMTGSWTNAFRVIDVIYATAKHTKELYTLVNCVFSKSSDSVQQFLINELYEGGHLSKTTTENCTGATGRINGLTPWINQPRYIPHLAMQTSAEGKIIIKEFYTKEYAISEDIKLIICEFCHEYFDKVQLNLINKSFFSIESKNPISRYAIQQDVFGFTKLLSLFTEKFPKISSLEFKFLDDVEITCLHFKEEDGKEENEPLITHNIIEEHFQHLLTNFFQHRDDYVKVIDLLNSSMQNKTAEISFLNIATGFNVFHQYFLEKNNESIRTQLVSELSNAGLIHRDSGLWDQIIRYHHLFKTVEGIDFFKNNFQNPLKTIELIKDSRNYYTHYSPTQKEIWTPNRLLYANKSLRALLKGVLLKQMGLPDFFINQLLNVRYSTLFYSYEKNEYSQNFRPGSEKNPQSNDDMEGFDM